MQVVQLWRYPVKSMGGEQVTTALIGETGMIGDRSWSARDAATGGLCNAKKVPALMRCSARTAGDVAGDAEITLPDGTATSTADAAVHDLVSAAVGHAVRLAPPHPAADLDFYRRRPPTSADPLGDARAMFGLEDGDAFPDLSVLPPAVFEFESPPGSYVDAAALMIMTTSALRSVAAAVPGSNADVRRFRPNVVVDTGDESGHPELSWAPGTRFRLGSAEIEIVGPCPRCVMTTREIDADLPADRAILRHIVRDLHQFLGTYARVITPGQVSLDDALTTA